MSKSIHNKNNWIAVKEIAGNSCITDLESNQSEITYQLFKCPFNNPSKYLNRDASKEHPAFGDLEVAWQSLKEKFYTFKVGDNNHELVNRAENGTLISTPLEGFLGYVDTGVYPPPELMIWLLTCFDKYYEAEGSVALEHIFFGRETAGIGNESARKAQTKKYSAFSTYVFLRRTEINGVSQDSTTLTQIADDFISDTYDKNNSSQGIDTESFLRGWRRWQKKNSTDDAEK